FRIIVFSLVAIAYTALSCRELRPLLREDRAVSGFILAVLVLHGLFYLFRMVPWGASGTTWLARPDFSLTVLENILVIVSVAYGILILVNNRAMLSYETSLQTRRDMLGHVSHDLRAPLAAMLESARLWRT